MKRRDLERHLRTHGCRQIDEAATTHGGSAPQSHGVAFREGPVSSVDLFVDRDKATGKLLSAFRGWLRKDERWWYWEPQLCAVCARLSVEFLAHDAAKILVRGFELGTEVVRGTVCDLAFE